MKNKNILFNTNNWIISKDSKIRYEKMRKNLREMNCLKAFKDNINEK